MTSEDETAIIAQFARALTGRYGPLRPSQAIARCASYIADLRTDKLAWAEIDRLFNLALVHLGCRRLSSGSVPRLYHALLRRTDNTRPKPNSSSDHSAAALCDQSAQGLAPHRGGNPHDLSNPSHLSPVARLDIASPADPEGQQDPAPGRRQLLRLEERREQRRRMDEA